MKFFIKNMLVFLLANFLLLGFIQNPTHANTANSVTNSEDSASYGKPPRFGLVNEAAPNNLHISGVYDDGDIAVLVGLNRENASSMVRREVRLPGVEHNNQPMTRDQTIADQVYRWDIRSPETIREEGFRTALNNDLNRENYNLSNSASSMNEANYIFGFRTDYNNPTSLMRTPPNDGSQYYLYEILAPGGIDVNSALGSSFEQNESRLFRQNMVAFIGGIRPEFVRQVDTGLVSDTNGRIIGVNDRYEEQRPSTSRNEINYRREQANAIEDYYASLTGFSSMDISDSSSSCSPKNTSVTADYNNENIDSSVQICRNFIPEWADVKAGKEEDFSWVTLPSFSSDSFRQPDGVFRLHTGASDMFLSVKEARVRGAIGMDYINNRDPLEVDWVFEYDHVTQSHRIRSSLNRDLLLSVNENGRLFLDIDRGQKPENASTPWDKSQRWNVSRDPNNWNLRHIENQQHKNMVLGEGSDYKNVATSSADRFAWDLQFVANPLHNGNYVLKEQTGKKALQKQFADMNVSMEDYHGGVSQQLNFVHDSFTNTYSLEIDGKYLDFVDGTLFFAEPTPASLTQQWVIRQDPFDSSYYFFNRGHSGYVLDFSNNVLHMKAFERNNKNQKWLLKPQSTRPLNDGNYRIASLAAPNYLFDKNQDRDEVHMYNRNDSSNQQWSIRYYEHKNGYSFTSKIDPNKVMSWNFVTNSLEMVEGTGTEYDANFILEADLAGNIILRPKSIVALDQALSIPHTVENGSTISAKPIARNYSYEEMKFVFESTDPLPGIDLKSGKLQLVSSKEHDQFHLNTESFETWFRFGKVNMQESTQTSPSVGDGYHFVYDQYMQAYSFIMPDYSNQSLALHPGKANETLFATNIDSSNPDQFWNLFENPDGSYRITNKAFPYKGALEPARWDSGAQVIGTENRLNDRTQSWILRNYSPDSHVDAVVKPKHDEHRRSEQNLDEFALHIENDIDHGNVHIAGLEQNVSEQQWVFELDQQTSLFHIRSSYGDGRVLAWDEQKNDGRLHVVEQNNENGNQLWAPLTGFVNGQTITRFFMLEHPNLCLTRETFDISHGMNVLMENCDLEKLEQQWDVVVFDKQTINQIVDPVLLRIVNQQINQANTDTVDYVVRDINQAVTINDLQQIVSLEVFESGVEDLSGIEYATNLETLIFHVGHGVKSLPQNFGDLGKLKTLHLHKGVLEALPTSFGDLTSLETVWLHENSLTDLPQSFGGLTNLGLLSLDDNQLGNISVLSNDTNFSVLNQNVVGTKESVSVYVDGSVRIFGAELPTSLGGDPVSLGDVVLQSGCQFENAFPRPGNNIFCEDGAIQNGQVSYSFVDTTSMLSQNQPRFSGVVSFQIEQAPEKPPVEVPVTRVPLDLVGLRAVAEVKDSVINVGGGVFFGLDTEENRFVVETAANPQVDADFTVSGTHVVKVYDSDKTFLRSYTSSGLDLGVEQNRKQFYEQINVVAENQFLVFEFERPISFVSVGTDKQENNVSLETGVTSYVTQTQKVDFVKENEETGVAGEAVAQSLFMAWLNYNLIADPMLQHAINQQINVDNHKTEGFVQRFGNHNISETDLQALTVLHVTPSSVKSLQGLSYATNLETLWFFSRPEIVSLPNDFGLLQSLRTLVVPNGLLESLPESFGNLLNLHTLDMSGNSLTALPESFGNLLNLHTLDMSGNSLTALPESFSNLANLNSVRLNNNQLTNISMIPTNIGTFFAHNQNIVAENEIYTRNGSLRLNVSPMVVPEGRFGRLQSNNFVVEGNDFGNCSINAQLDVFGTSINCAVSNNIPNTFVYSFNDTNESGGNFFSGVINHRVNVLEPVSNDRPVVIAPVIEKNVGVSPVSHALDVNVVDLANGAVVEQVSGVPVGLSLNNVGNRLRLQGVPQTPQASVIRVEVRTVDNVVLPYELRLEITANDGRTFFRVGQSLEQFNTYYSPQHSWYASFGEIVNVNALPAGVRFVSNFNYKWCDPIITWSCHGDSTVGFSGVPTQAGVFDMQVHHRGVRYVGILFIPVHVNYGINSYRLHVCENDALLCGI